MASRTRIASIVGVAVLVGVAGWFVYTRSRPEIEIGAPASSLPRPNYVASNARIDIRTDTRGSGLILKHEVLRMTRLSRPKGAALPGDTLIYADSPELARRVDDVLQGRLPVLNGIEANFAIGKLAPVRIVRLDGRQRVTAVEDVRASFVAFTID
ncbi:MAG: hypothetical protein SGJ09_07310 [Phycisphaerae bacterium]|nr:hypothetical protein [Phycisphaerae bacterium]